METTERKLLEPRKRALPEGVSLVHAPACRTRQGSTCDCEPSFMTSFGLGSRGVRQRATFQTLDEAVVWRARQVVAKSEARLRIPSTGVERRGFPGLRLGTNRACRVQLRTLAQQTPVAQHELERSSASTRRLSL